MQESKLALRALAAVLSGAAAIATGSGCGGDDEPAPEATTITVATSTDDEPTTTTTTTSPPTGGNSGQVSPETADKPHGSAESGDADPRLTAVERSAAAAVRRYVAALAARDASRICATLAPGVAGELETPVHRGDPCEAIAASVGYRDPRGLPVWEDARVTDIRSIDVEGSRARVVATVVTRFADRDEESVEDDVVYLVRDGEPWLVAKPSSTLYRSIGTADVPPSVLTPPG